MASSTPPAVAVYRRGVRASLDRVWENVLDWEHLPWLHRSSFSGIERIDSGAWGWRARVGVPGPQPRKSVIELEVDRPAGRYVARTLEGFGSGTEIWTRLESPSEWQTAIAVEFCVPGIPQADLDKVGASYTRLYTRLWDEDEAMMLRRQEQLDLRRSAPPASREPVELGPLAALRERLPLSVELDGRSFRIVESRGELLAHSTLCPHMLGPLEAAPDEGRLCCPWHGYAFDLHSGRGCDGNALRLAAAPRVEVDSETSHARLVWS